MAFCTVKISGTRSRASHPASVATVTTSARSLMASVATTYSLELLSSKCGECGYGSGYGAVWMQKTARLRVEAAIASSFP